MNNDGSINLKKTLNVGVGGKTFFRSNILFYLYETPVFDAMCNTDMRIVAGTAGMPEEPP